MTTNRITEKINELIYGSRDKIYSILRVADNLSLVIALSTLVYSLGFDLEADETTRIFKWLEILIAIFILDYFIRMVYSFQRWQYIRERRLESIMVALSLIVIIGYIFGIDIPYNLFLFFGLTDFRSFYEFFIATYLVILTVIAIARASRLLSAVKIKPAATFIFSFIFLILIGTFLLMMPAMTTDPGGLSFLDALFTSTSASCVTGLSVITVGSDFTFKGQIVTLILLQLGGIGMVSFATFFASFLTQGIGVKQQAIIQDVLSSESLSSAKKLLQQVVILTFSIEAIGAVAIFFSWNPDVVFYSPVIQEETFITVDTLEAVPEESGAGMPISLEDLQTGATDLPGNATTIEADPCNGLGDDPCNDFKNAPPKTRPNCSLGNKIYYSIFHSVSAFCNAGFSLFPDGLYQCKVRSSYILHLVIAFIIIFGSLGFSTIQDVFSPRRMRQRLDMPWKQWSLSSQIAVNMTIFLTIIGTIGFYFLERNDVLSTMNLFEAIVTAFFQSVTTRTAGFNTVDLGPTYLSDATYIMFIVLMFIGAAPGSTGGGIKTSTILLLVVSSIASIRGKKTVEIGKRSISNDTISRAFSIVFFAIAYNFICIFLLMIVEDAPMLELFFEQISAFATVGLSQGITSNLNSYSKVIIIVTMYLGRVGMLTLALALSKKVISTSYKYPVSHVMVG